MSKIKFNNVKDYQMMCLELVNEAEKNLINILSTTGRIEFDAYTSIQPIRHFNGKILLINAISYDEDSCEFLLELANGDDFYDSFEDDCYDIFDIYDSVRDYLISNNMLED